MTQNIFVLWQSSLIIVCKTLKVVCMKFVRVFFFTGACIRERARDPGREGTRGSRDHAPTNDNRSPPRPAHGNRGQTSVRSGGQGQSVRVYDPATSRTSITFFSTTCLEFLLVHFKSSFEGPPKRWWPWPTWRARCATTTATRMSTCSRRTTGTGTCCSTRPGSNSRGK